MIGIIGGSGIYGLPRLKIIDSFKIDTPFGDPSCEISKLSFNKIEFFFLPRHGLKHQFSPTKVNYRANIYALKSLGVKQILSFSACGSLNEKFCPGDFVLVDDYVDFTKKRESSFFEKDIVAHVSMARPSCSILRKKLSNAMNKEEIPFHDGGTYVAIEGPQFSSLAESLFYKNVMKCDVIGMTNMPEAKLAREAEICYQTIAMVTDFDCWNEDIEPVTLEEIQRIFAQNLLNVEAVLSRILDKLEIRLIDKTCDEGCNDSLNLAILQDLGSQNKTESLGCLLEKYIK